MGEKIVLVGKLNQSPRLRGEDNIRMVLKEIQSEGVKWVHLVQDSGHNNDPLVL